MAFREWQLAVLRCVVLSALVVLLPLGYDLSVVDNWSPGYTTKYVLYFSTPLAIAVLLVVGFPWRPGNIIVLTICILSVVHAIYGLTEAHLEDILQREFTPLFYAAGIAQSAAYASLTLRGTLSRLGLGREAETLRIYDRDMELSGICVISVRTLALYAAGQLLSTLWPAAPLFAVAPDVLYVLSYYIAGRRWLGSLLRCGVLVGIFYALAWATVQLANLAIDQFSDRLDQFDPDITPILRELADLGVQDMVDYVAVLIWTNLAVQYIYVSLPTTLIYGQLFRIEFVRHHVRMDSKHRYARLAQPEDPDKVETESVDNPYEPVR